MTLEMKVQEMSSGERGKWEGEINEELDYLFE